MAVCRVCKKVLDLSCCNELCATCPGSCGCEGLNMQQILQLVKLKMTDEKILKLGLHGTMVRSLKNAQNHLFPNTWTTQMVSLLEQLSLLFQEGGDCPPKPLWLLTLALATKSIIAVFDETHTVLPQNYGMADAPVFCQLQFIRNKYMLW